MRFLVDESTGAAVAEFLREQGHEVLAVAEAMPQAEDADRPAATALSWSRTTKTLAS